MRIASYELAARAPVLRDIRVNFEGAHPTMDKYFIYKILGGRIDPAAPQQAFVNGDGSVRSNDAAASSAWSSRPTTKPAASAARSTHVCQYLDRSRSRGS